LSAAFLLLLLHAWLRGSALSRLAGVGLALGVLLFASPNLYRALRRTALLSERERVVSNLWTRQPASPFESGMFTMYREAQIDFEQDEEYRYLAVAALAALAAVPAFSRRSDPAPQETEAMPEYPPAR
jgi:hypothetical protein